MERIDFLEAQNLFGLGYRDVSIYTYRTKGKERIAEISFSKKTRKALLGQSFLAGDGFCQKDLKKLRSILRKQKKLLGNRMKLWEEK